MRRHEKLISRAVEIARTSEYRWQHGAVVAKGNKILGSAPNKFRNHPIVDEQNVSDHAEHAAIRELLKVRNDLRGCTIYVARVNKAGFTTMSRPCEGCLSDIIRWGIKEFVYTNEIGGYSIEQTRWTRQLLH